MKLLNRIWKWCKQRRKKVHIVFKDGETVFLAGLNNGGKVREVALDSIVYPQLKKTLNKKDCEHLFGCVGRVTEMSDSRAFIMDANPADPRHFSKVDERIKTRKSLRLTREENGKTKDTR